VQYSEFQTDLGTVSVNHNSDWSGIVYVRYYPDGWPNGDLITVKIPGRLLLQLGQEAAKSDLVSKTISFFEQL
jgi:hypothetical protein